MHKTIIKRLKRLETLEHKPRKYLEICGELVPAPRTKREKKEMLEGFLTSVTEEPSDYSSEQMARQSANI